MPGAGGNIAVRWRRNRGLPGPRERREDEDGHMSEPTAFGRIDDDGTVYVKTAAGERVVGSWQAGTPDEGLAHFVRRFTDVVTEVDLIEARLSSGAAEPGHAMTSLRRIRGTLDDAHVVGDLDSLAARIDKLVSV